MLARLALSSALGFAVFHTSVLDIPVVHRLRKPICQVEQVLGHSDRAQQLVLNRTVLVIVIKVVQKELLSHVHHCRHRQDLITGRAQLSLNLYHRLAHFAQLTAEMIGYARVLPPQHLSIQTCHIICSKRWPQSDRLIENAPQRPDVTLHVIRLIAPNLGTGVVRGARLRIE